MATTHPRVPLAPLMQRFLDEVAKDGVAEVSKAYADEDCADKRRGAVKGFEEVADCRSLDDLVQLRRRAEADKWARRTEIDAEQTTGLADNSGDYWFWAYRALQIEFSLNCLAAVFPNTAPLTDTIVTYRGYCKGIEVAKRLGLSGAA